MCNKCDKIDEEIEHLKTLASKLTDQPTIKVIEDMIEKMLEEKIQLHAEEDLRPPW